MKVHCREATEGCRVLPSGLFLLHNRVWIMSVCLIPQMKFNLFRNSLYFHLYGHFSIYKEIPFIFICAGMSAQMKSIYFENPFIFICADIFLIYIEIPFIFICAVRVSIFFYTPRFFFPFSDFLSNNFFIPPDLIFKFFIFFGNREFFWKYFFSIFFYPQIFIVFH